MLHQRVKLFAEFDGKFADVLPRLVDACLNGVVENGILVGGRCTLLKCLVRFAELPFEEVEMRRKVREHRGHTGTVESEVLEQRREDGESLVLAQPMQGFEEHHHALCGAFIERFNKRVRFQPHLSGHLSRFLEQLHNGTL